MTTTALCRADSGRCSTRLNDKGPREAFLLMTFASIAPAQAVRLVRNDHDKRVDITVDGKPFTSYRWDERIMRPVLYPILSSGGSLVTRGFPFETRDGDTIDHPHQVGCSFSYGNVNNIDFWNSSTFRTPEEMKRMGRISHIDVVSTRMQWCRHACHYGAWIGRMGDITYDRTDIRFTRRVPGAGSIGKQIYGRSSSPLARAKQHVALHLPSELT